MAKASSNKKKTEEGTQECYKKKENANKAMGKQAFLLLLSFLTYVQELKQKL